MSFGTQLREYREEYLEITQKQMAMDLGIDAGNLSRYESDRREFPIEHLPLVKKVYNIPDDIFLAMVLDRPLKTVRSFKGLQTLENQSSYTNTFMDQHVGLIESEPELKEIIMLIAYLSKEDRKLFLSAIRNLLQLFENQLRK
ncbi:helix-turn-helix domain-containing protein [Sporosarcina obsidiansis]|uniref:helix-turn-helix domain-containing protein n=1 Tax=Sporosarcina obsidiansis TaxID=2660748 RepID=UPI001891C381|nr:helix-turn-helix transcriptional regulator [Sporosarcina obsidiansis]